VSEVAETYKISRNHLVKVVQNLVKFGYVESTKGRGGGMKLAQDSSKIVLGQVVRKMEPDMHLIDCIGCEVARVCKLPGPLHKAISAFIHVLDEYSLSDIVNSSEGITDLLHSN
jgi:Rrf2 family nitric oxide-sensitive transcriptional repressor